MLNNIPKIALGTWSWGIGNAGGDQVFGNYYDENSLKQVFDTAIKEGLNLWDTAAVYAMGDSERILGKLLKDFSGEKVFLSTKFTPQIAKDCADPVLTMCDESLNRLGKNFIDIYWIHNPQNVEKWTQFFIPLFKSGKIKHIGLSNHNLKQIKLAEEILSKENIQISAIQNHFSLLYRSSEKAGILDYCEKNNINFFAYMVLEQGALTGVYTKENPLPEGSQRANTYNKILSKLNNLIEEMKKIAQRNNATVSQIAIAYAIAKGTIPIVGVTKTSHVYEAKNATQIILTSNEIMKLEELAIQAEVDTKGAWENSMLV